MDIVVFPLCFQRNHLAIRAIRTHADLIAFAVLSTAMPFALVSQDWLAHHHLVVQSVLSALNVL